MKRKFMAGIMVFCVALAVFAGCGNSAKKEAESSAPENPMQYVSVEDLKADIDGGGSGYVILDVRKKADYDTKHITGAVSADVDAAKNGDDATGTANLKAALKEATGSETGSADTKYALICYSGKSYAQKATDLLIGMEVSKDNIYTLEGGTKAWEAAGDDYTALME